MGRPTNILAMRAAQKQKEEMADTRLQSIKVVAVDDNADTRALLKVILKLSSAEAAVVDSGQEALRAIKQVHPDVLICDLAMPEMDGYQLLENVRRLEPEFRGLSAIAFTAASSNEDRAATKRAGFQVHLVKPITPDELVTVILKVAKGQPVRTTRAAWAVRRLW